MQATKSEVFKYMLSSDTCKAAEIDSVCLPEFDHDELKTFLELLYCGNLAKEKFEMHYYSLALASHKYAIPYLEKFCEDRILNLVDLSNAFKVLEISEACSNETLKVAALELIRNHKEEILCSFEVTSDLQVVGIVTLINATWGQFEMLRPRHSVLGRKQKNISLFADMMSRIFKKAMAKM
ncbi:hypothetical protein C5167_051091 [Papaver somniferum]|uniref:BTB domain-containing protein n=1 Tax=Papaver somniferum TaxID=3469 RepID=A0A4Y7KS10_PAPSO|nr:hypothetical protein C5167_051091 [Papaver somniferum]